MIEYTWQFPQMRVKPQYDDLNNVIIQVDWCITAHQNAFKASSYGRLDLQPPDPNNFVDLNAVTSHIMQGWVEQHIPNLEEIKQQLSNELTHMAMQADQHVHTFST